MGLSPLYVVTSVFNPRRFSSRVRLYQHFARWLQRQGIPLLTVEIAFGDRPHVVTQAADPWHLQLRTNSELWHKERGLNLGLQRLGQLVPDWEHVAWIDADVKLARDDWAEEAVHLLQHYAVLQLFGEAVSLDPSHHQIFLARSILRNYEDHGEIDWYDHPGLTFRDRKVILPYAGQGPVRAGHPGLAWAFRRAELDRVGRFLDICVNGSGDLHMAGCFTGRPDLALPRELHPNYRGAILRYGERCERHIKRNVSYMPGLISHYWHGKAKERGYEERGGLLVKHRFDPVQDLVQDSQGLYAWSGDKLALEYAVRKSLSARNEDSIDL